MMQFIAFAALLLASAANVQAEKSVIGKPTGMVDPKKRRHLEKTLNMMEGKDTSQQSHRGSNSDRNLQAYYGSYPGYGYQDYYGGGVMKAKKGAGGGGGGGAYKQPYQMPYQAPYQAQQAPYQAQQMPYQTPYQPPASDYYPPQQGSSYYPPQVAMHKFPPKLPPPPPPPKGKKGKKGPGGPLYPKQRPIMTGPVPDCKYDKNLVQNPFNDVWEFVCDDDDCEMLITSEEYVFLAPDAVVTPAGGNTTDIGTTFIWGNQNLLDPTTLDPNNPLDAAISGTCTRTSEGGDSTATGVCTWSLVNLSGDQLTITGALFSAGGNMVITGGSGTFAGMIGDAVTIPYIIGNGDIFEDAQWYQATLTIGYIVCPAQLPPDVSS